MASDIEIPQARQSILGRVIRPDEDDLSADAARSLLRLHFEEKDLTRMLDLAERNKLGRLTKGEEAELRDYRNAVAVVELLRSKARLALKRLGLPHE